MQVPVTRSAVVTMFSTAFICWKRHDLSESSQGILGKATWAEEHKKQKLEKAILSRVDFIIQWDYDWILASFFCSNAIFCDSLNVQKSTNWCFFLFWLRSLTIHYSEWRNFFSAHFWTASPYFEIWKPASWQPCRGSIMSESTLKIFYGSMRLALILLNFGL